MAIAFADILFTHFFVNIAMVVIFPHNWRAVTPSFPMEDLDFGVYYFTIYLSKMDANKG
jgi:hypothetical protein